MKKLFTLLMTMILWAGSSWAITVTIGTGTSTTRYPLVDYFIYSRSQMLFLASEVTTGGTITHLRWFRNDVGADPNAIGITEIWLMETPATTLSGTAWEGPGTLVATISNIDLGAGGGWYEIDIADFSFSGASNLLLSVRTQNAPYTAPHAFWRFTTTSPNYRMRQGGSDSSNPPTMALSYSRPNLQIEIIPLAGPPACANNVSPADLIGNVLPSATLNWSAGLGGPPTGYKLYFGTDFPPTNIVNGTNLGLVTTYDPVPDMNYSMTYFWQIVPTNTYGEPVGCPIWSFTTGPDPTIMGFPYCESYDGPDFPPYGWITAKTAGTGNPGTWDRQTTGTYPICSPHSGVGMTRYNSYSLAAGTAGILVTPPINFPNDFYSIGFWMYRDDGYPSTADLVNVYYNTAPGLPGAILLGTINRARGLNPPESANGWYQYYFNIPTGGGGGGRYIVFEAVSQYGNNIFLDDVCLIAQPVCVTAGIDQYMVSEGTIGFGTDYPVLPPDFFGPGSQPFEGEIYLQGQNSDGGQDPFSDASVSRLTSFTCNNPPCNETVPIEILSLKLVSSAPVCVKYGTDNDCDSFFDVFFEIDIPDPSGSMSNILVTDQLGGTFGLNASFHPLIKFVKTDDPGVIYTFDPESMGYPSLQYSSTANYPWTRSPIACEFDPDGDMDLILHTPTGATMNLIPFLERLDNNFNVAMNDAGVAESWTGNGYNNGEWYFYPNTNWWNVWWYDHRMKTDRTKYIISPVITVLPRSAGMPSSVEIVYTYSTPAWPGWITNPRPPLPSDVPTPSEEELMIQRSPAIYQFSGTITQPIPVPLVTPYIIYPYNPEWISVDIRGYNYVLNGLLNHVCFKKVTKALDFGDAPAPYPTLLVNNGARHTIVAGVFMGNLIDGEANGQPNANASGDDNNNLDDEDGVTFNTALTPGQTALITVKTSIANALLQGWIDFNANGSWADPGEQIAINQVTVAGNTVINFIVPPGATSGQTCARFRYSTMPNLTFEGAAPNGEVEDYKVNIETLLDFGDSKDPLYPTLLASNGARHFIAPNVHLGNLIDAEADGLQSFMATGDDLNNLDDEDGVIFTSTIIPGLSATVSVTASVAGFLHAWIDFDGNGNWGDPGDKIFSDIPLVPGLNNLTYAVPASAQPGNTYARFRFVTVADPTLSYTGLAPDGEVEDYYVAIISPTGDRRADPDPLGAWVQNEISLAVTPGTTQGVPAIILAAYNDHPFPGGPGLGVAYSTDGGTMWNLKHMTYPIDPYSGIAFADAFDPTTVADGNNNLYVGHISTDYDWTNGPSSGLFVHKSTDNGVTWTGPYTVATNSGATANPDPNYRFNDRCQLAVDLNAASQYHNRLYVTWIKDRGWNMSSPMSDIYFSYSTNGGVTWSPAVIINETQHSMGNMPIPAVGKDGAVYICWIDYNVQTGGSGNLYLDKSTDGGVTWRATDQLIRTINLPPINLTDGTRAKGAAIIKTSPLTSGELYITFAENPGVPDYGNIYFIRSTDFGLTWSAPLRINDDVTINDQVMPWMDVKPNGTIDIAWYDKRNDPANLNWDVYFTSSPFSGTLFSTNAKINDNSYVTPTTSVGKWMGEYLGLKTDATHAYIAFTSSFFDSNGDILFDKILNPDVMGEDWGDAPDPRYPTYNASNGARHTLVTGFHLGSLIDPEPDGLSTNQSSGDDANNLADEDGVTVNWGNTCGWPTNITVNASAAGFLDAWWDFGMNGWGDPGEQIFNSTPLVAGNNILNFVVPPYANRSSLPGYSSRFRFSQQGGLSYTGPASSGEVEDYQVQHGYADEAKWKQPVDTNQMALHDHDGPTQQIILADDFYCWEGNITAIRWFGTYEAPGSGINHFHLSIHNNGSGTCLILDPEIWGMNVPLTAANQQSTGQTNGQGELIFSYQYILAAPLNLSGNGHYWLDISVISNNPSIPCQWKWQESARSHVPAICSAESRSITGGIPGAWTPIYWSATGTYTDLAFQILSAMDFGDAPAPYPTLLTNNGACHGNDGTQYLGTLRDTEANGQPSSLADGDDLNGVGDDEDGVTLTGNMTPGGIIQASIVMGTAGVLQAFVDFNADGDWSDAGEWALQNQNLAAGTHNLLIPIPASAALGVTYVRFRVSNFSFPITLTNVSTGYWPVGEVEDYRIQIMEMLEYGDAPDPGYPTLFASNGARHMNMGANIFMGVLKDFELNGQPNVPATGDDLNNLADEDGVTFTTPLAQGQPAIITVVANIPNVLLQAWIDFNADGDWADPLEQIATNVNTVAGNNTINFTVPATATLGTTYARFRISTMPNLSYSGLASNGEVEDYTATIVAPPQPDLDYGDAPDPLYPTLLASNGARHTNTGLKLGARIDVEPNGQPNATATGDDNNPPGLDDEDGIFWFFNFVPGHGNTIRVTASGPGYLNAWMDFNNNGTWEDPAEKIFSGQAISAGVNDLSMFVPANAALGSVFARFRFSSTVNLAVTGLANDGEVEDYQVPIQPEQGMEYGDAPDSYKTLAASNGARHDDTGPNVFMGAFRDLEMNGQPNATASGDDINPPGNPDDEDGVIFLAPLIPGLQDSVSITVNMIGGLQEGWIDFNGDGSFNNAAEHIIINQMTAKLITHYIFNVPAGATPGKTYARFRYSTQQNVPSFGPALNGEVEDYVIYIGEYDLGDAPGPYPTLLVSNGAIHKKSPLFMGLTIDAEPDGQPSPKAWGDDNNPPGADDEDGIWWACHFVTGYKHTLKVTTTGPGFLNAWFDYNSDGDWTDANEQVFTNVFLLAGSTELFVTVPVNATADTSFGRFRFSSQQNLADTGYAADGEVEDYRIIIVDPGDFDLGDAPDPTYPTLGINDGARHYNDPFNPVFLGNLIDWETDGQPTPQASGDDSNNLPDEEGIQFLTPLIPGQPALLSVTVSITGGAFQGWIDFNGNGDFSDPGDQIFTNFIPVALTDTLTFPVPGTASVGNTYARFRYSTMGNLSFCGCANNGEVEDYMVAIVPAGPGDRAVWHLDENNGNIAHDATVFHNDGVITGATWTAGYSGSGLSFNGSTDQVTVPHSPSLDIIGPFSVQAWIKTSGNDWYYAIVDKLRYISETDSRGFTLYLTGGQLRLSVYSGSSGIADVFGTSDLRDGLFHHVFGSWDGSFMRVYIDGVLEGETGWTAPPASSPQDVGIGMRLSGWGQYMPFNGIIDEVIISTDPTFDVDFGDAPDPTYPTLGASNGARHKIGQPFLGGSVDAEVNGLPHPSALGDDNNNIDDENGIILPAFMLTGQSVAISVTTNQPGGFLQGWIDFNRDGDWADGGEQVFTNLPLPVGVNNLNFNVPAGASLGRSYARFRLSTNQNLSYTGYATDGEVEDYVTYILNPGDEKMHWVQYPDLDPTGMDVELTWVPTADDFMCTETGPINKIRIWGAFIGDDLPVPLNSTTIRLQIFSDVPAGIVQPWSMPGEPLWSKTYNAGQYSAKIVSTNSPEWYYDPAYQVWVPNHQQIVIRFDFDLGSAPFNQVMGNIYWLEVKRFEGGNLGWKTCKYELRFNDDAVWWNDWPNSIFPGGWNAHVYPNSTPQNPYQHPYFGQTFDMAFHLNPPADPDVDDFGDAPDPGYPTLLINNGARHLVDGITYLGAGVDTELDGQPIPAGMGDDNNGLDDEDGITFDWLLLPGNPAKVTVTASTNTGFLNGWIDFNDDGDWADPGEQVFTDKPLVSGPNKLHFFVPLNATPGITYARFRYSTQLGLSYTGAASDGEVEDYEVEITTEPNIKWTQLPDVTLPGLHAHDAVIPPFQSIVLADDWQCNGGMVTDIHWWGNYEVDGTGNEIKGSNIHHFHISIHNQTGATCLPTDPEVWGATIQFSAITEQNTGLINIEGSPIYLYEYLLPVPFNQVAGNNYWVDITAFSNNPNNPAQWRWQEAMRSFDPILCGAAKKTDPSPGIWSTILWNNFNPPKYSDMAFTITSSVTKTLNLKLYLEGLYIGDGFMHKAQDEYGEHFGGNTADQVTVELHKATNYATIEYSVDSVNLSTGGNLTISTIPGGYDTSYYITIKHRNHIETTTALPVSFAASTINYDFSTAASQAYGDNMKPMGFIYAIYGGDVNQDGIVDTGDMNPVENASTFFIIGYIPEDANGDGVVDTGDMNIVENNSTNVIQKITP